MKTIQFEIPEGFEVDNFDKATGKVSLKPKPLELGKITTFEQVCERMNENPKDYEVTETHPRKRGHQILGRILLIIECFQAGAKLDVYNTDQRKYQGWYDVSEGPSGFRFHVSLCTSTHSAHSFHFRMIKQVNTFTQRLQMNLRLLLS